MALNYNQHATANSTCGACAHYCGNSASNGGMKFSAPCRKLGLDPERTAKFERGSQAFISSATVRWDNTCELFAIAAERLAA